MGDSLGVSTAGTDGQEKPLSSFAPSRSRTSPFKAARRLSFPDGAGSWAAMDRRPVRRACKRLEPMRGSITSDMTRMYTLIWHIGMFLTQLLAKASSSASAGIATSR